MEQRFAFDQVARAYQAVRPDYADALIDDVIAYAGLRSGDVILDVGCGTGQATKSFATRGFAMLALDPGPQMIGAAREALAAFPNVSFAEATFEAWSPPAMPFRLITAAQSWHWVPPGAGFAKAAEVLAPDGTLAVFGHVPVGLDPPLLEQFKQIYQRHIGYQGPPPEAWYLPDGPFKPAFEASALFGPITHRCYPWQWRHTTASYLAFLRTRSDHQVMAPAQREAVFDAIAAAIDGYGGAFAFDYETHLYMAHRASADHP